MRVFGKLPKGRRLARIEASPYYRDGAFQNPQPTEVILRDTSMPRMFREYYRTRKLAVPRRPMPSVRTDLRALPSGQMVWFGHSSYFLKTGGLSFLVDPVFSGHASPFSFFARAFPGSDVYKPEDFDPIDVLVLTHDHYDHLDYLTVKTLAFNVGLIVTSLGVGAHLEYWGIPASKIVELGWFEYHSLPGGVKLTAAPARHFSGRLFKRAQTQWSSFVLEGEVRLFLGGDSGYGDHFPSIGDQFGPFDLGMLECGQYGTNWPNIHMFPEQTAQAARDLRLKALLPVHWGKFSLALHPWDEPIRRLTSALSASPFNREDPVPVLASPRIGEPFPLKGPYPHSQWWHQSPE